MRRTAPALLALLVIACTSSGNGPTSSSSRSSLPAVPVAETQAAGLRAQLDLLLGEQVMIVAKQAVAAQDHADSYTGYAELLSTNGGELADLVGSAFGATAASQFAQLWNSQNGFLVDYTIGAVSHDSAKSATALTGLTTTFVPRFAQLLTSLTQVPLDPLTQLTTQQALEDRIFIDDVAAQKYASVYADLHTAYAQTTRLGDALVPRIVQQFPDKFPGDPSAGPVDQRVRVSVLLQEHSYLATMAGDAAAAGRTAETTAAVSALASNADSLGTAFGSARGAAAATQFDQVWAARDTAIATYATSGDAASRSALTDTFVAQFAALTHLARQPLADQVAALLKVLDEQRAKATTTLAADDRSAATATQPIAEGLVEG